MHEFSMATDIAGIIIRVLGGPRKLDRVNLTIGPLAAVSPESLRFCFAELAGSLGLGSPELVIDEVPAGLVCLDCGLEYRTGSFDLGCPRCGSIMRRILSGGEFTVDSVELSESDGGG